MARTDPQVNIRIPRELLQSVAAEATRNNRSTTAEIISRLHAANETLRDRFAMAALTGGLAEYANPASTGSDARSASWHAERAYEIADAMLEVRGK